MGGAGTLTLLLALTASPRHTDAGLDFDEFRQAEKVYVAAWVKGSFAEIEPYISPKFVYMRNDYMMQRDDYIARTRNQMASRFPFESGVSTVSAVVPELNGYTADVKRHYESVETTVPAGTGALHQDTESRESWVRQAGRWMISSVKLVSRRVEWHMKDGSVFDVTNRRR